ncbi:desmoglein-2.1-like [Pseudorasbora parva]|uniref:desmoglein-2.1-like n=1 Tax=Pseudorasbora parva TaxID=51549 RepID=UPI00351DBB74
MASLSHTFLLDFRQLAMFSFAMMLTGVPLCPPYEGPFRVLETENKHFVVDRGGLHQIIPKKCVFDGAVPAIKVRSCFGSSRYIKASDPDNWLSIDETTGAVRLNKAPDRESKFLVDGVYYATIYSITQDWPSKMATGTIAIQVEDFNDHCPTLLSKVQTLCTDKDAVLVTAVDEDAPPNGAPFTFNVVPEGTKGKWSIEHLNEKPRIGGWIC